MKNDYKFKCEICGNSMVKAGKNSTGKQRYKCKIWSCFKIVDIEILICLLEEKP